MAIKAEVSFSLKDELFNPAKVQLIAKEIAVVYPTFATQKFVNHVTKKFPELELMERLFWIRDCLREFLPAEYQAAATILLKSLPRRRVIRLYRTMILAILSTVRMVRL